MVGAEQPHSRIVYPKLPEPLTEGDLLRWFTLTSEERQWAPTVSRWGTSMLALLTQLKVFQHIGRFLPLAEIPPAAIARVAAQLYQAAPATLNEDRRTLYRHHHAIRLYLGITPWGPRARGVACDAIAAAAQVRTDPADLINAAIDALIRESCELPQLSTLRTMAGAAHRLVNATQWQEVYERLSDTRPPESWGCAAHKCRLAAWWNRVVRKRRSFSSAWCCGASAR